MTLRRVRSSARLAWLLWCASCSRAEPPKRTEPTATVSAQPVAVANALSTPTAFALAAAPFGASLVWAEPGNPATLRTLDLNTDGLPERDAWELARANGTDSVVSDLSFAWQGMNRAATWLERTGREARVGALLKTETESAATLDLGPGFAAAPEARGNIALASSASGATAFVRGATEPCDESEPCYGFRFHRFGSDPSGRVSLSVPVPCTDHAAQIVLTPSRWYYAVCTTSAAAKVVTLFTIQPEPEYAAARQIFAGCTPLGAMLDSKRGALVAQCEGGRQVAWLGNGDSEPVVERLEPGVPDCKDGPQLVVGSHVLSLDRPRANLELILPETLVPHGALAAWTGRALVVARSTSSGLTLTRHGCRRGQFVPLAREPR
jgi:hypothetical protein